MDRCWFPGSHFFLLWPVLDHYSTKWLFYNGFSHFWSTVIINGTENVSSNCGIHPPWFDSVFWSDFLPGCDPPEETFRMVHEFKSRKYCRKWRSSNQSTVFLPLILCYINQGYFQLNFMFTETNIVSKQSRPACDSWLTIITPVSRYTPACVGDIPSRLFGDLAWYSKAGEGNNYHFCWWKVPLNLIPWSFIGWWR